MKLVVLGGGESGVGTAILGKKQGYEVFLSDFGSLADKYKAELDHHQILWEEKTHTEEKILDADVVMKSPGIPDKVAIVKAIRAKGIQVVSEIEFASWFDQAITIGITGSNGKTTTTMLTHHVLQYGGCNVGIGGNIGKSYAAQVAHPTVDSYVLELSSFQLDDIEKYRPHIAVITNISPDHLDRYDYKYENYIASKFRITMNQTEEDYLIYDADDEASNNWLNNNKTRAQLIPFSITKKIEGQGAYLEDNNIIAMMNNEQVTIPVEEIAIEGKHNVKNAMAATLVAQMMRVRKQSIRESLSNFQGVEHRLEKVAKINRIQFINDSKATNVNATYFALESMTAPTVWIVGGVDKGNDYDELLPFVHEKVKAIVCLGIDNEKIKRSFSNVVDDMIEASSMEEAVILAASFAEEGDTVLLSPACASFDLFKSYEDRGTQFKNEVSKLE